MESIESGTGQLARGELAKTPEAPEANAFRFTPSHVLYGKLRPYLNKVFAPDFEGKSSTELVPLLPGERLDRRYLAYFLRSPSTVAAIAQKVAGARMPRADMSFVMSLPIPILPLSEQQRIVEQLFRAENIVRMRREAEQKAKEIIPALFLDMFGTTLSDPVVEVDACLAQTKGAIRTGPFGSQLLHSEFTSDGISVLGIDNVVNNRFEWSSRRFISHEKYQQVARYTVHPGDVLITIMGTCGRCAIVPESIPVTINTKHLCAITLERSRCVPQYLHGALLYDPAVRRQLAAATKGAIMEGLNMQIIRHLKIRLPSIKRQTAYGAMAGRYDEVRRIGETAMQTAERALQSLLAGVFSEDQAT